MDPFLLTAAALGGIGLLKHYLSDVPAYEEQKKQLEAMNRQAEANRLLNREMLRNAWALQPTSLFSEQKAVIPSEPSALGAALKGATAGLGFGIEMKKAGMFGSNGVPSGRTEPTYTMSEDMVSEPTTYMWGRSGRPWTAETEYDWTPYTPKSLLGEKMYG